MSFIDVEKIMARYYPAIQNLTLDEVQELAGLLLIYVKASRVRNAEFYRLLEVLRG